MWDALVERMAEHSIVSLSIRRYVVPLIYIKQKGFFDRDAHYHFRDAAIERMAENCVVSMSIRRYVVRLI